MQRSTRSPHPLSLPPQCVTLSDAAIIAHVRAGRTRYFDCIIVRYERKLRAYVTRLGLRADDAADVVQTVFVKALRNVDTFDPRKKLSPWLYRIARNETMNWFAARKRATTISIDDPDAAARVTQLQDDAASALDEWFAVQLRGMLREAIDELPAHYATVIRMHYFDDLSYKEIATALNKPVGSVGTLLHRAKKRLLRAVIASGKL